MLRIYPAELSLSRVEDPVYNSASIAWLQNCKLGHTTADGCVHTADTTQLDFVVSKFAQTRRHCRQLSATQYTPPTRLNSTVALRRRCVLGFSVHIVVATVVNTLNKFIYFIGDTRFFCGCAHCLEQFTVKCPVVRFVADF